MHTFQSNISINKKFHKKYLFVGIILLIILLTALTGILFIYRKNAVADTTSVPAISNLQVCHLTNPLGIDETTPIFSWQMHCDKRGSSQSAYRITMAKSKEALLNKNFCWDSGKIISDISVGIPYQGEALQPKQRYFWQVSVWNELDEIFVSTEEAWFETGLMEEGFLEAKWISVPKSETIAYHPVSASLFYDINYQITLSNTSAGFLFGAHEGRYGALYVCEIKNTSEQVLFSLKQMDDGRFISEETIDITSAKTTGSDSFRVHLSIRETILSVTVNDIPAGEFAITSVPAGSIGYYKSRGVSYAYFDNILVKDTDGVCLYEESFEDDDTIFSPYYVALENNTLKAGSGLVLTPYYEAPAPYFRKEFTLQDIPVESARLYMTALGSFSLSLNGKSVSSDYFSPGKLAFNKQLSYMTYDVTSYLKQGQSNALGMILLHGFYDRAVGYPEIWNPWGDTNALLGELEIRYADGTCEIIPTDKSFLCYTDGPVRSDDIYQGEFYDATKEITGFDLPGYSVAGWLEVAENAVEQAYLSMPVTAKKSEPITCIQTLTPVSVTEPVENVFVYDFGQNFTGTCRIRMKGERGQILTLRYGEHINTEQLINQDDAVGTIWTENLLTAEATDYYVLKGDSEGEIFEPSFTFHGFRYLQISGIDEPLPVENVQGIMLSSSLERTGSFTSSDALLNQFYQNTVSSQQSNFLDNPTDCPQRDERHGWAGDAQVYSLTASYHANTFSFYEKYLEELRLIQTEGGSFADMAPRNFATNWDGTGGAATNNCWGDAPVVITWNLYTQYGDTSIIAENYDALCKWVDVLVNTSENYIRRWGGYGDHLALESTPADLSDTAWCARSADLLSKMSEIMNKPTEAAHYKQIYENFKKAWQLQYILPDGMTICNTQTSYALGLSFGLFPAELEEAATNHLLNLLKANNHHIMTGFSGIGYLLPALSNQNQSDAAYRLLLQTEAPSLLYQAQKGATTTWELWNGYLEEADGTYYLDGSFNHYTYGTPAGWLYTHVLGIQSDEKAPGYKHILLTPQINESLSFAKGSYASAYGLIRSEWKKTKTGYQYLFEIPANTTATLTLPPLSDGQVYLESEKAIEKSDGITLLKQTNQEVVYTLTSGTYHFTISD